MNDRHGRAVRSWTAVLLAIPMGVMVGTTFSNLALGLLVACGLGVAVVLVLITIQG